MTSRSALTCPVCGAPREPGSPRCGYCGSWLVVFPDERSDAPVDEDMLREHVARFRSALADDPENVVALYGLGVAWRNLGLLDDATRVLARAANRRPESLSIQRALAGTLLDAVRRSPQDTRMWRDVRRQAERILALDPDAVEGWRLLGEVALRTEDGESLIALAPCLAEHDVDDDHREITARLHELGDRRFHDWRWAGAVDAWEALASLDSTAGRTALVDFLLQNARLVPRSAGNVWRAMRQTMALRGDFRQSTVAALALGIAIALVVAIVARFTAPDLFPAVTVVGLVLLPIVAWIAVRTWLVGWPPYPPPAQPWRDVSTREMVAVARSIAPLIEQVRPSAGP